MLSLTYPDAIYKETTSDCPYTFGANTLGNTVFKSNCSAQVKYTFMDGELFLTYRKVSGNIKQLLTDAQKLTYEHVQKADDIAEYPFVDPENKVYGMFYDVSGNAASQSQFYITDSANHFLTGSIYFNTKPNYDSILPAAEYLKKDISHLLETVRWKE